MLGKLTGGENIIGHVTSHTRGGELCGLEKHGFKKLCGLKSEFKRILKLFK